MAPTPNAAEIAYMMAHASDNLKADMIVSCTIMGVASLGFLVARIWSRLLNAPRLHPSDWMVIVAWFLYMALFGTFLCTIPVGGGKHAIFLTDPGTFALLMICNEVLYCTIMGLIKCSLLAMYGTIFPSRRFQIALWTTAFLVVSWALYGIFTAIFQCVPLASLWDTTIPGHCIDYGKVVIAAGVENILLDFLILALPVPMVWRLHMSAHKRRAVVFTFAMGGSASIVSIIRQAYAGRFSATSDPTWDDVPVAMISVAELMAGFLASSIPTYRPLWLHLFRRGEHSDGGRYASADSASVKTGEMQTKISVGGTPVRPGSVYSGERLGPGSSVTRDVEMLIGSSRDGRTEDHALYGGRVATS